jgi:hypothetical protein
MTFKHYYGERPSSVHYAECHYSESHFAECHSAIFSTKFVKEKVGEKHFAEKFVFANFLTKKKERTLVRCYSAHSDQNYSTFMLMK